MTAEETLTRDTRRRSGYRKTERRAEPRSPAIESPIEISTFWKNRKGDAVRVSLQSWEGFQIVDIRQHFTASDGTLRPTKKGITLAVRRLPDLADALRKALAKAVELGLVEEAAR